MKMNENIFFCIEMFQNEKLNPNVRLIKDISQAKANTHTKQSQKHKAKNTKQIKIQCKAKKKRDATKAK